MGVGVAGGEGASETGPAPGGTNPLGLFKGSTDFGFSFFPPLPVVPVAGDSAGFVGGTPSVLGVFGAEVELVLAVGGAFSGELGVWFSRAAVLAGGSSGVGCSRSLLAITTPTRLMKEHETTIPTLVSRVIVSLLSVRSRYHRVPNPVVNVPDRRNDANP